MVEYSDNQTSERLFRVLVRLPPQVKAAAIRLLATRRRASLARLATPGVLTFYVTYRCFASCEHCFLRSRISPSPQPELTIQEIRLMLASLRHRLDRVAFGGGESFLREDIVEIYASMYEINRPRRFWVATPGLYPEKTHDAAAGILKRIGKASYVVSLSLEGPPELHDRIIGVKDAFAKAMETAARLGPLKKRYPNFDLRVLTTVSSANIGALREFIARIKRDVGLPHLFNFVWGSALSCFSLRQELLSDLSPVHGQEMSLSVEQLRQADSVISAELDDGSLLSGIEALKRRSVIDIMTGRQRVARCAAPSLNATVFPDGAVSFCEFSRAFGNLREFGMDFLRLWQSAPAGLMREGLRECACTLPYILSASLSYDEQALRELAGLGRCTEIRSV